MKFSLLLINVASKFKHQGFLGLIRRGAHFEIKIDCCSSCFAVIPESCPSLSGHHHHLHHHHHHHGDPPHHHEYRGGPNTQALRPWPIFRNLFKGGTTTGHSTSHFAATELLWGTSHHISVLRNYYGRLHYTLGDSTLFPNLTLLFCRNYDGV